MNLLLILTDQHTADALSCAGNPYLSTPSLDALAARGTRFSRAYCAQPLCTPSRASLMTGRMPTEVGVTRNEDAPADLSGTLGVRFREAGYDCGYAGKWHLPELDVPPESGFERLHGAGDEGLVDACRAFLARPRERPYLLVASFTEPHGICQVARGQHPPSGPLDPARPGEWPPLPPNHAVGGYDAELPRIAQRAQPHSYPTQSWDDDDWRAYRHAYYRLVERADAMVGELLDAAGPDTFVLFTADHGDQAGAHRWNQKWVLHEECLSVPLIISRGAGLVDDRLVNNGLDVLPTLLHAAGLESGPSLLSPAAAREAVFAETEWVVPGVQHLTGRSVRTDRYRYTCYAWGRHREQLFDLRADPGELVNLATTGAYGEALAHHRTLLGDHVVATGDRFARFLP
ncbi:sulfatase-like hydrolase/transferase [Nonomuraea sp. NBC_01738]|uniref:sulfatase family protein n=1 Tax=Nonomuraea sp. NBC_01738 TaxID=2976003 RepID=UPI002E15DA88|nr:sulfatase-like hydrolase/transferase [Nonomuraea sp. NBC_01738]